MNDFDVVVIGNVGIDTCLYLYGDDIDFSVAVLPELAQRSGVKEDFCGGTSPRHKDPL